MLRYFLWANCFSCAVFGVLFLTSPAETAQFIGSPPEWLISTIGLVLIVNTGLLACTAAKLSHLPNIILFFVAGDAGWVAITVICIVFGVWIEGLSATLAAVAVALVVGGLGVGQYICGVVGKHTKAVQHH